MNGSHMHSNSPIKHFGHRRVGNNGATSGSRIRNRLAILLLLEKKEKELLCQKIELELKLLKKEVNNLTPKRTSLLGNLSDGIKKRLGIVLAWTVLIGSITTPILEYMAKKRQEQFSMINNNLLNLIPDKEPDSLKVTDPKKIETISIMDPKSAAPFIFSRLSSGLIDPQDVIKIYHRMYTLNIDKHHYGLFDKFLFYLFDDNQEILESELQRFTKNACYLPDIEDQYKIADVRKAYVKMIYMHQLQTQERFQYSINSLIATDTLLKFYINSLQNEKF